MCLCFTHSVPRPCPCCCPCPCASTCMLHASACPLSRPCPYPPMRHCLPRRHPCPYPCPCPCPCLPLSLSMRLPLPLPLPLQGQPTVVRPAQYMKRCVCSRLVQSIPWAGWCRGGVACIVMCVSMFEWVLICMLACLWAYLDEAIDLGRCESSMRAALRCSAFLARRCLCHAMRPVRTQDSYKLNI